jgi:hypothetical protein
LQRRGLLTECLVNLGEVAPPVFGVAFRRICLARVGEFQQ